MQANGTLQVSASAPLSHKTTRRNTTGGLGTAVARVGHWSHGTGHCGLRFCADVKSSKQTKQKHYTVHQPGPATHCAAHI
eukprot:3169152-Prymnesium_polylepis.1